MQQWEPTRGRSSGLLVLWWAIVAVALVLGLVLIVHGNVVVGALVAVLASLIFVLLVKITRRRVAMRGGVFANCSAVRQAGFRGRGQ